jgi:predicted AAA+ superfamily ATPase
VEPALVGPLLGVDPPAVLRDPDLLGRMIETFVLAQLRPELSVSEYSPRMYHLRQRDGRHEIDLIIELADGRVIAIEVKAASTATAADARHLSWLREQIGDRLLCGLVLHTGPHSYPIAPQVHAAPICSLWTPCTDQA